MPFRPRHSFLRVDCSSLSNVIHTDSVEDLFGMWSLFSKTSHAIDEGRRLENLSWRLWNRETFCCRKARDIDTTISESADENEETSLPALSTSCESASSTSSQLSPPKSPPELKCASPCNQRHEKHITSNEMQILIQSIEDTKDLEPLELELPMPSPPQKSVEPVPFATSLPTFNLNPAVTSEASQNAMPPSASISTSQATLLESSASTVDTQDDDVDSQIIGSENSSNTEMSTHSVVRGFVPGGAPSSYRSQTNLHPQPTPILKSSARFAPKPKKKGAMFTIGTSSGEDESSLESHMYKSSLSESIRRGGSNVSSSSGRKQTSFKDEVLVSRAAEHSPVFEESDDEDEEVSESAIDDDDDSSDWEDSDDHSRSSSVNEKELFQRVDSRPNLTSRRSLLTTLMHEPDRAKALANAASRSTSAIRRSGRSTPNGPSVATSPVPSAQLPVPVQDTARSRPIMTSTNIHQQVSSSPRTTRRNMLSTELTESLRKNLLWERQHRSTGNLAALKRRQASEPKLRQPPEPAPLLSQPGPGKRFTNDYFDAGLQEYHAKGW